MYTYRDHHLDSCPIIAVQHAWARGYCACLRDLRAGFIPSNQEIEAWDNQLTGGDIYE